MSIFRTNDQTQFAASIDRFLADACGFDIRRRLVATEAGFDESHWRGLADLGALGVLVPEAHGGSGGGGPDGAVVMEAIGRRLFASPYLATAVLGADLLRHAPSAGDLLAGIAKGTTRTAFAVTEPESRYNLADVATQAKRDGEGWRLSGAKGVVAYAGAAHQLLVTARTGGARREEKGIGLFLVDAKAAGVEARAYPTIDGSRASEITLENVRAETVIGDPGNALPLIEHAVDLGAAMVCAEAVGAMTHLYETTLAYMKTRKQFGVTIGSFQALQHRMVEVYTQVELARSMAAVAATAMRGPAANRARDVSAAKLAVDRAGRHASQEAIQLHGGMGMTDELDVGHYAKRVTMIALTFGDGAYHMTRYQRLSGLGS
ncbi:MAG: pimeloyl-CoA dehydrogenase small subunit [Alphaproteobacteria bacterium]|nr:pimeloyl-CoA dehydrogenase small subunit [Alphaproteobacteria bacterium]